MKNLKKITALTMLFFMSRFVFGQNYQQLPNGEKIAGAQVYMLPKAAIQIEVNVLTKVYTKGSNKTIYNSDQLDILTKKYGLNKQIYNSINQLINSPEYSIAEDSIKLSIIPLADFSKIFYTYPKKKWNISQSATFTYGNDGILTDAETSYENRTADIIFKGVSTLASVVAAFKSSDNNIPVDSIKWINDSIATIKELDDILSSYVKLDRQNNIEIYKDLKATFEKAYNKAFAEIFYGVKTKMETAKLLYCPSKDANLTYDKIKSSELFELDKTNGKLYYNSGLGTDIVWVKNMEAKTNLSAPYKLNFKLLDKSYQQMEYYETKPTTTSYFGYNIPAKTLISLVTPTKEENLIDLYKIPQFGIVAYVNAKKMKLSFQLDPTTGELKKMSTESKAITDDQIGNAGAALNSIITTIKGDDAAAKLEKEVKQLENEKKKRDLIKELIENP